MIYKCDDCGEIFRYPIVIKEKNEYYKDGIYTSCHCNKCMSQNIREFNRLYDYGNLITHDRDKVIELLSMDHENPEEVFNELVYIYD